MEKKQWFGFGAVLSLCVVLLVLAFEHGRNSPEPVVVDTPPPHPLTSSPASPVIFVPGGGNQAELPPIMQATSSIGIVEPPVPQQPSLYTQVSPDAKNATYAIWGAPVTLRGGVHIEDSTPSPSASKIVTRYFGDETRGDFDGDGVPDTAFLLTQNTGGTGEFFMVAVALGKAGGVRGTNAVFLDDRIAPQNVEWRNGRIIVNYATRKIGDPMTAAPSVGVSRYFYMSEGMLMEETATSSVTR